MLHAWSSQTGAALWTIIWFTSWYVLILVVVVVGGGKIPATTKFKWLADQPKKNDNTNSNKNDQQNHQTNCIRKYIYWRLMSYINCRIPNYVCLPYTLHSAKYLSKMHGYDDFEMRKGKNLLPVTLPVVQWKMKKETKTNHWSLVRLFCPVHFITNLSLSFTNVSYLQSFFTHFHAFMLWIYYDKRMPARGESEQTTGQSETKNQPNQKKNDNRHIN